MHRREKVAENKKVIENVYKAKNICSYGNYIKAKETNKNYNNLMLYPKLHKMHSKVSKNIRE
jgi:hypothetical protein